MPVERRSVWVVDNDAAIRHRLSTFLGSRGFDVACWDSGDHVLRQLSAPSGCEPSLLLLDLRMPRVGALDLLTKLAKRGRHIPSIILSGLVEVSTIVQAMQLGAADYLVKPIDEPALEAAIARALETRVEALAPEAVAFVSSNARMLQIKAVCDQVARTDVPVLILGESGVGKEVVARYIHAQSGSREPFVKVNCAALPTDLLESELFGHERGAFTGAQTEKPGKFEQAGRGTIMLDEVGDMIVSLQAKLLHVLQDGEYARLGGTRPIRSEARIIAATNKRLHALVETGEFREDLYFRLNVITLEVPALRERPEDIPTLCARFVEQYRARYKSLVTALPPQLLEVFSRYHWPGNVRQLENYIRRFLILPDVNQALAALETPAAPANPAPLADLVGPVHLSLKDLSASAAENVEKELIQRTLTEVHWNRREAARRLNICYKSLLNKLHRWEFEQPGGSRPPSNMNEIGRSRERVP
jgi:two-component system response regulator AtoC